METIIRMLWVGGAVVVGALGMHGVVSVAAGGTAPILTYPLGAGLGAVVGECAARQLIKAWRELP